MSRLSFDIADVVKSEQTLRYVWNSGGILPPDGTQERTDLILTQLRDKDERVKIQDALAVPNAPMMFPKVIQNIVREAVEPLLIGTSLLTRINYQYGQTITFGATGGLVAADIGEGQEYPEQTLNTAAGTVQASIGKSGLAIKITEEMLRYSQFDVIGMHLRAAGRALARHKEVKIFNLFRSQGVTAFDNLTPAVSLKGVTTGRNRLGTANGSLTMDDLFDMWALVVMQGFMPNTLVMHPLTWTMFVKDATMREFVLQNGGGNFFATWTGNPQGGWPSWKAASNGGMGPSYGQNHVPDGSPSGLTATPTADQSQIQTGAPVLPSFAGFMSGLSIVVTPYIPYNAAKRLTDIYLLDRNETGFLIVDEDPVTQEFDDPRVDIKKIKVRERYALAMNNEGHAIAVARNVKVVPNEVVLPATVTLDSASVPDIDAGTAVV